MDSLPERVKLLLEGSIVPSPHSTDFSHTAASDFLYRQLRKSPNVAELYHENSKVNPYSTLLIPSDDGILSQVRKWFFETAYSVDEEALVNSKTALRLSHDDLPLGLENILATFSEPGSITDLLYAADVLVLNGMVLSRVIPQSAYLWVERTVTGVDLTKLSTLLRMTPQEIAEGVLIFVVACPWRYMLLYGPRGYRHTLLDIGRLLGYFENHGLSEDYDVCVRQNFHDTAIDDFILADGLERSVYSILHIRC